MRKIGRAREVGGNVDNERRRKRKSGQGRNGAADGAIRVAFMGVATGRIVIVFCGNGRCNRHSSHVLGVIVMMCVRIGRSRSYALRGRFDDVD